MSDPRVGLIVRFPNKEAMESFVKDDLRIGTYVQVDKAQVRPMDALDPKDLYILNRGKDGYPPND